MGGHDTWDARDAVDAFEEAKTTTASAPDAGKARTAHAYPQDSRKLMPLNDAVDAEWLDPRILDAVQAGWHV